MLAYGLLWASATAPCSPAPFCLRVHCLRLSGLCGIAPSSLFLSPIARLCSAVQLQSPQSHQEGRGRQPNCTASHRSALHGPARPSSSASFSISNSHLFALLGSAPLLRGLLDKPLDRMHTRWRPYACSNIDPLLCPLFAFSLPLCHLYMRLSPFLCLQQLPCPPVGIFACLTQLFGRSTFSLLS